MRVSIPLLAIESRHILAIRRMVHNSKISDLLASRGKQVGTGLTIRTSIDGFGNAIPTLIGSYRDLPGYSLHKLERVRGIKPLSSAWKAEATINIPHSHKFGGKLRTRFPWHYDHQAISNRRPHPGGLTFQISKNDLSSIL